MQYSRNLFYYLKAQSLLFYPAMGIGGAMSYSPTLQKPTRYLSYRTEFSINGPNISQKQTIFSYYYIQIFFSSSVVSFTGFVRRVIKIAPLYLLTSDR